MAKKGPGQLTLQEVTFLQIAARLLAAIRYRLDHPPVPSPSQAQWDNMDVKALDELVCHCVV